MSAAACTFCRVVRGDTPAVVVARSTRAVVFLDHRPLFEGHCLVVPPAHHETLVDLPPHDIGPFFQAVRRVAAALEGGLDAGGTFVAMNNRISQSVPHLHVHVVPRNPKDGLRGFFWPRHRYPDDQRMRAVAERIADALAQLPAAGPP